MGCNRCHHHSQSIPHGFFDGVSSLSPPLPVNTKRVFWMACPGEAHGRTRPNQGPVMDERPVCLCRLPGVAPFTPPTFTRALHCAAFTSSPFTATIQLCGPSLRLCSPFTHSVGNSRGVDDYWDEGLICFCTLSVTLIPVHFT
jgi:hypothetical protein